MTARPSPFAAALARIAHEAGQLILRHYAAGPEARFKADASPVTAADEASELLRQVKPTLPVLLANLTTVGQIGVTYHASLEQLLVQYR